MWNIFKFWILSEDYLEVSQIFCNLAKRNKIISLWHTIRDGKRISAAVAVIKPTTGLTAKRTRQMYRGSLLRSYCCWVECSSCRCSGIWLGSWSDFLLSWPYASCWVCSPCSLSSSVRWCAAGVTSWRSLQGIWQHAANGWMRDGPVTRKSSPRIETCRILKEKTIRMNFPDRLLFNTPSFGVTNIQIMIF